MFPTRWFSGFLRNEGVFAGRGHQHFFPGGRGGEGVPTPVLRDGSGRGGCGTATAGAGRVPGDGTGRVAGTGRDAGKGGEAGRSIAPPG